MASSPASRTCTTSGRPARRARSIWALKARRWASRGDRSRKKSRPHSPMATTRGCAASASSSASSASSSASASCGCRPTVAYTPSKALGEADGEREVAASMPMLTTVSTPASRASTTARPGSSSISRWQWVSISVMGSDGRGRGAARGRGSGAPRTASGARLDAREERRAHDDGRRREAGPSALSSSRSAVAVRLAEAAQDLLCRAGHHRVEGQRDEAQPGRQPVQHRVQASAWASSLASFHGASSSTRRLRRRTSSQTLSMAP